jgi:8-oxo-dGTP diphosphatase
MVDGIRQFGTIDPAATYVLRLGGYAVVVRSSGQVALVSTKGGYYLPGGGQEEGESAEAAAVREALEECGARIRLIHRIGIADELVFAADERTHFRKRCTFFRAELLTEEISGGESDHTLLWISAKQAVSLLRHESQRWAVTEGAA